MQISNESCFLILPGLSNMPPPSRVNDVADDFELTVLLTLVVNKKYKNKRKGLAAELVVMCPS